MIKFNQVSRNVPTKTNNSEFSLACIDVQIDLNRPNLFDTPLTVSIFWESVSKTLPIKFPPHD